MLCELQKQHLCHFRGQKFHFWTATTGKEEDLKLHLIFICHLEWASVNGCAQLKFWIN